MAVSLIAIAADQFFAPILYSSSPLWATAAGLVLVWRRGLPYDVPGEQRIELFLSNGRVAAFVAAHGALILVARSLSSALQPEAGTLTDGGTFVAAWKLSVLAPTILLFPIHQWKKLKRMYRPEGIAALIVLLTYFPGRVMQALWPWYGHGLGRFVYALSRIFVPGVGYAGGSNPMLTGADLNVTIIPACSGINGIELFDYLFGGMAILDWNRLKKGRALAGYFLGLSAMLIGNALRITSLVVLGNRGFAGIVSRYHLSAGWIFFSAVFLLFLSMTYPWMLNKRVNEELPKSV